METFVIRVWSDLAGAGSDGGPDLKGEARQVGSGATIRFHDAGELIRFLISWPEREPAAESPVNLADR
jgi:hypothetical protein